MNGLSRLSVTLTLLLGAASTATAATTGATPAPAAGAGAAASKPTGPNDHALIQALWKGYNAGFNAKDAKKVMSYYAHDGLFVFDVTPPRQHVGWDSYRKDWQDLFAAYPGPLTNTISEQSITVVGPVAYGHNIQDTKLTDKDGKKTEVVVRVTDVFRKIAGKWLIVQEHVSVPVDLATGKPDLLSKP